jgi:hypothetical protein
VSLALATACADAPVSPGAATSLATARTAYPRVKIGPAVDTLRVGATVRLRTTLTNRQGHTWPGQQITWTSSDTSVLRVVTTGNGTEGGTVGNVTARKAGRAVITARTRSNTTGSVTIVVSGTAATPPDSGRRPAGTPSGPHGGFFVAPGGSSGGDGSAGRPWDLATALSHPGAVQAGDTIWLRGGTYRGQFKSRIAGRSSDHVVVRQYPGERATIDGSLYIGGASTTYWGFEVMNSSASRPQVIGVDIQAPNTRVVNLVVHDHGLNGVGFWSSAPDAEVYGTIIYNNGYQGPDRGHGHGIYAQNTSGTKRIADNVIFNQFGYGIHVYGSSSAGLKGFDIEGNVSFNNGSLSRTQNAPDLLVGGGSPAERITVTNNYTYQGAGKTTAVFGDVYGAVNNDLMLRDNYLIGTTKLTNWRSLSASGNTFAGAGTILFFNTGSLSTSSYSWDRNSYVAQPSPYQPFALTSSGSNRSLSFAGWQSSTGLDRGSSYGTGSPSGTRVFVRENRYEPGRATVVVYNWGRQGSASVDVSSILPAGGRYEVRNVQNYYGSPVASGTYNGGSLTLPLGGVSAAAPVGGSPSRPPSTGPEFNVFVITSVGGATTYASGTSR